MPELTNPQILTLKTDLTVTRVNVVFQGATLGAWYAAGDDNMCADFYNQIAVPTVLLWRPAIPVQDLIDSAIGSEYIAGTTAADVARRSWFDKVTSAEHVDATRAQVRANFSTAAGAASTTLTNWTAIARKNATYGEALYVTSTVGGASLTDQFGLVVSPTDIIRVRAI